jgi:AraC-like DNA-binding protein
MHYLEKLEDKCIDADLAFLTEPSPGMNDLQKAVFDHRGAALLLTLFELSRQRYDSAESQSLADRYVGSACRIIYNEFSTIRRTEDIAARIGISQHYLRHIFKDRCETGIKEFLINVRLERAGDLLVNSTLPLKAIADYCGFSSERHLCTVFKKLRGVSPGAFRAAGQK